MIKLDNFYFTVDDIRRSTKFYTELLGKNPTNIIEGRWTDWENENGQVYFGVISKSVTGSDRTIGNNGVLGLYTDDIDGAFEKCKKMNTKILYGIEEIPNSSDHYKCFAIEDFDGNKIEIAYYDK